MQRLVDATHRFSRLLVWVGGSMILLSALLVTLEIFLRKFANISLGGADEISGYAFGVATTLGFAYALFERAHIRVDALFMVLPRPAQIALNFLGLALLTGFAGIIASMGWDMVADTMTHGSRSITPMRTPLAWPQVPWLAGWLFFVLCGCLLFLAALVSILRGDSAGADRLIGMKSLDEQIEDEKV